MFEINTKMTLNALPVELDPICPSKAGKSGSMMYTLKSVLLLRINFVDFE